MSPSATGATRTVCVAPSLRADFTLSLGGASDFSNFCHATRAATASTTTIAIRPIRLRRRGCGASGSCTGADLSGAGGVVGARRSATSGLNASFIRYLSPAPQLHKRSGMTIEPRMSQPAVYCILLHFSHIGVHGGENKVLQSERS